MRYCLGTNCATPSILPKYISLSLLVSFWLKRLSVCSFISSERALSAWLTFFTLNFSSTHLWLLLCGKLFLTLFKFQHRVGICMLAESSVFLLLSSCISSPFPVYAGLFILSVFCWVRFYNTSVILNEQLMSFLIFLFKLFLFVTNKPCR